MTAKELIVVLQALGPDTLIVLSKDGEGNGFSPLADVQVEHYRAESPACGEIVQVDPEDPDSQTIEESDVVAAIFWPVN